MDIRPIAAVPVGPQGLDALAATAAPARAQETTSAQAASAPLDPPVKLDLSAVAHDARFVRDRDTSAMVFQVVDHASGDVVAQLPSETALRDRAYAAAHAQTQAGTVSRVA